MTNLRLKAACAAAISTAALAIPLAMATPAQAVEISGANGPCADVAEDVSINLQTGQITIGKLVVFYGVSSCL